MPAFAISFPRSGTATTPTQVGYISGGPLHHFSIGGTSAHSTAKQYPDFAVLVRQGGSFPGDVLAYAQLFREPIANNHTALTGTSRNEPNSWAMWFNLKGIDLAKGPFQILVYNIDAKRSVMTLLGTADYLEFEKIDLSATKKAPKKTPKKDASLIAPQAVFHTGPTGTVSAGTVVAYGGFKPNDTKLIRADLIHNGSVFRTDNFPYYNPMGYWSATFSNVPVGTDYFVRAVGDVNVADGSEFDVV